MAKWTYQLTVYNELDRTLHLDNVNIAFGEQEGEGVIFPETIAPGALGKYYVCSLPRKPSGIEFYLTFSDVPPVNCAKLGTLQISVNMPFLIRANQSSCTTTGLLLATGFQQIPAHRHNFSTPVTVSSGLEGDLSP